MLSVVVPTLEEEKNIPDTLFRIGATLKKNYEILVVDDNSEDRTRELAENLSGVFNVRVIEVNYKDYAKSVMRGISEAKGDCVCVIDGDGQHCIELIPDMLSYLEEHDIIISSCLHKNLIRNILSAGARYITKLLIPKTRGVAYPTSSFVVFKKSVVEGVEFKSTGFKFLPEILLKGKYKSIKTIHSNIGKRKNGKSKVAENILKSLRATYALAMENKEFRGRSR